MTIFDMRTKRVVQGSLFIAVLCSTMAQGRPPKRLTPSVIYLVEWDYGVGVKDPDSTATSINILKRCYGDRCVPYDGNISRAGCPSKNLCEVVFVKEVSLQGGGFQYLITNRLLNGVPHEIMRERPLDFSQVKSQSEARQRAMKMLDRMIKCHDVVHHVPPQSSDFNPNTMRTLETARVRPDCGCDPTLVATDNQGAKGSDTQ